GDVGFGKTEVAMNAIYKAVLSGYQVAVISPLLVLADEHYETFLERLGDFGVRVGILTRMSSPSEARNTLADMKNGNVDIVVGTHRLLSEDIAWKKLGLLVIDEEHKFGVSHKERIKKIRANIDILSLSATPIPRSLNLALSGLKKISLLTTPPKLKKPIETIVSAWNEATIRHAIRYELDRGGQVIVVVNRIRGMESVEKEIEMILDEKDKTKIIITHGRLDGDEIENRIHAFKKREYDILLTTTIIENGVNFLSANTIIILDPEDFGLAQLHQLRGRVGRKNEQGYCYLVYRKGELAADAKERIITIANNRHLGAGFEIAMRDMEIRGAGDVLGFKQAGKSKEIGLTLYFRMLEEKIESIKNEKKSKKPVKIELDIDVNLEEGMFLSETDKLNFFREIENIESIEELDDIESEMQKNKSGKGLFLILKARLLLAEYGVQAVKKNGVSYTFDFYEGTPTEKIRDFLARFDKKNDMILLSIRKIKIETRLWKNAEAFLETITSR
ncbi:DEAD/DEAH box helicase, partial [Candidatus Gracilibacteria bacterium]|nr:DEAD/DEAH box helicase [Candidatus Gracilibacteria bacterium]